MRIICYINKLNDGGAERVMSVLANGLVLRGHEVTMITDYSFTNEYPLQEQVEKVVLDGAFVEATQKGRIGRTLRRIFQLNKLCRQTRADIMISFMRDANFRAILSTRLLKTKNLISVRIDPKIGYKSRVTAAIAKLLYPLADGYVFQTEEAKAWFPASIRKKSIIILNPISDAFYRVRGTPMSEKRIVTCGRLDNQKNFSLLISAFDMVCDQHPEYCLEIYGTGKLKETLQNQIDTLGRNDRIRLMGRCEDIPNAIKNASLFVLSSDFEGLPNALMEAMALGLPVISTDCSGGGARALIDQGVDGLIVPRKDQNALAKAIAESLNDPEITKNRGEKARHKAAGFSAPKIVDLWEEYIVRIVGE